MSLAVRRPGAQPLRMRLLLVAASGLVPLAIVLAWGVDYLVDERRAQAQRTLLELSRALAIAVDGELRSTATLLHHLGTSGELERGDLRAFHDAASRMVAQLGWRQVILADADGKTLLRTQEAFGQPAPAPTDPASIARVIETQAPVVTHIMGAPDQDADVFGVTVPVIRSGKIVYVLTGVLPTDTIFSVLTRRNMPSGSTTLVFDQRGRSIARAPQVASPFATPSVKAMLDRGDEQGVGRTKTREGTENYTGYTRLRSSGWVVVTGNSAAESNRGLYALLRAVALGLAASLGLAVWLAWALSRRVLGPIDALKEGAASLGRGAPVQVPPLDVEELDELAVALKDAAADRDRSAARVNEALRAAEEANRTKDQFLAVLGHELRNPLAPITTAVRLMALKGDDKTAQERRIIERQLAHVTRLVDDLLDISRITSGRLEIRREPVRVALVLTHVVDAIRSSLYQHSLSLELTPAIEDAWVAGDEVRLVQIFNNLLVNAVKFTPAGGTIRVTGNVAGGELQVQVEDTGIGVSQADLDRIFDLFYQGPQGSDRAKGGLGLGLSIVKSLAAMHGGSVHATSAGVGQGTRVTVRLPLCEAPSAGAEAPPAMRKAGGEGTILVVDDNQDAADTCAALLEMSGYSVRVAYTPGEALEALRHITPMMAILDIGLPGMSGYELAARMRAAPVSYAGRLVALTGYGLATDMATSRRAGFDAHLTKPVSPAQLLELVDRLSQAIAAGPKRDG